MELKYIFVNICPTFVGVLYLNCSFLQITTDVANVAHKH